MYPHDDKDLDRLFRKAAEQYDPRTSQPDWENLEQRLDKELPVEKKKDRRRFLWFLLLIGLVTGGGLTWLLTDKSIEHVGKNSTTPTQESYSNNANESKNPKEANENGLATDTEFLNEKNESETDKNTIVENSKTQKSDQVNSPKLNKHNLNRKQDGRIAQNRKYLQSTGAPTKSSQPRISTLLSSDSTSRKEDIKQPIYDYTFPKRDNSIDSRKQSISVSDSSILKRAHDLTKVTSNETKEDSTKSKSPSKNRSSKKSGFEFGLIAGIDYSNVKSTGTNKPGYDVGLHIAYHLNRRWSLNTGIIFTRKNYDAAGKDYNPPKHYWTNYVDLKGLSGYCEMWDIPLNVRYNFTPEKRLQWFANTGLSTYIMRKQYYEYYYTRNNISGVRDWTYESQQNHWLSVLNISGGFEKRLKRPFTLQVEPFAKIPLAGVGFGKMKIATYGAYFILKYRGK